MLQKRHDRCNSMNISPARFRFPLADGSPSILAESVKETRPLFAESNSTVIVIAVGMSNSIGCILNCGPAIVLRVQTAFLHAKSHGSGKNKIGRASCRERV